jgi:redox-sensitive bicupin YhaK (pirin superfamily)
VSGPVTREDEAPVDASPASVAAPTVDITPSREAEVGAIRVRRALPRRARRTVGAWCFLDHMGPVAVAEDEGVNIGPHPHIGLQTVTWLLAGEVLHRDSLGSEQIVRPGQLNLMTGGAGVAHAEEATGRYRGDLHGVQLWVAQPDATRHGEAAFEHVADLPHVELDGGDAIVIIGDFNGASSPARRDTDHLGVELSLRPSRGGRGVTVPTRPECEYAMVVLEGEVVAAGQVVVPGQLAYLGIGRDELPLSTSSPARALLIGGVPFPETLLMWWNFVARTRDEVDAAITRWQAADARLDVAGSRLARIDAPTPPWASS